MNAKSNANVTSLVTLCAIVVSVYCIRKKNYILYILRRKSSLLSFSYYIYLVTSYDTVRIINLNFIMNLSRRSIEALREMSKNHFCFFFFFRKCSTLIHEYTERKTGREKRESLMVECECLIIPR